MENVIGLSVSLLSALLLILLAVALLLLLLLLFCLFALATRIFQRDAEMREMARTYTRVRTRATCAYACTARLRDTPRTLSLLHIPCTGICVHIVGLERA